MIKKFPEIKKELQHFISDESGIISKETILRTGVAIGSVLALSKGVSAHHVDGATHTNELSLSCQDDVATGNHSHQMTHSDGC